MSSLIKRPLITEKNSQLAETGIYVFEVDRKATKEELAELRQLLDDYEKRKR